MILTKNQRRICVQCAQENNLELNQLLEIEDILDLDSESAQKLLPCNIFEKVKQIKNKDRKINAEIETFYINLIKKINKALQTSAQNHKNKMNEISQAIKSSDVVQIQKNSTKQIQQILYSAEQCQNSEKQLQSCFTEYFTNISSKDLEPNVNSLLQFQSTYSTQKASNLEKDIISQIENIKFFHFNNSFTQNCSPTQTASQQSIDSPPMALPIDLSQVLESPSDAEKQARSVSESSSAQSILSKLQFMASQNYNQSWKNLKIELKQNDSVVITNISNSANYYRQCYLQTELQSNKTYVISLSLNNQFYSPLQFCFGLIDQQDRDEYLMSDLENAYYYESSGGQCQKIIKRGHQASEIGVRKLELKICIKNQSFIVSTLPAYESVVGLSNKNLIKLNKSYLFAISIKNPGDSVTVDKILEVA